MLEKTNQKKKGVWQRKKGKKKSVIFHKKK
jgi:hypothetical protein